MSNVTRVRGVTVYQIDEDYDSLDDEKLEQLSAQVLAAVETANPPVLLLDLTKTKFIGSRFLGVLIRAWKRLRDRNGHMALCHVNDMCDEVLRASKLNTIWDVYAAREEAVQALAKEGA